MKRWTRWQDWVVVAAGLFAMIAPLWASTEDRATWTLLVLGGLMAVSGVWSLAMPGAVGAEWTHIALGVLMGISPWVMGFTHLMELSWTAWITGVVSIVMGALALPESRTVHRGAVPMH
jgi:uncharacterized membrane protein HdeD (DUF308 family)